MTNSDLNKSTNSDDKKKTSQQFFSQMSKSISSVRDLNWAWQYFDEKKNQWIQFDCTECLAIEFDYQVYYKSRLEEYKFTDIILGQIDFETLELTCKTESNLVQKIRRTSNNYRARPNIHIRHSIIDKNSQS